jgi:uncharacterized YigZ family protein
MDRLIPAKEVRNEILVQNSRFIATLSPVFTLPDAKSFISQVKDEFPDATHNVPAYIIGHGNSTIAHCSDDGEPSGTAGKPVLAVLKGSGFGDVVVVVTRYFGGKKLGTGGLVRAYRDAAKSVIDIVPRALKIPTYTVMIEVPYIFYERVHSSVIDYFGIVLAEVFGSDVTISARFPVDKLSNFNDHLREFSQGKLSTLVIEETESIMPHHQD